MEKKISRLRKRWAEARSVWDETALQSQTELPKLHKFAHFCLMVWRSFTRNRCPSRASALAYATLLALIPMLAVVMSITSTFLKKEGEERIDSFIMKMVASVTPPDLPNPFLEAPVTEQAAFLEYIYGHSRAPISDQAAFLEYIYGDTGSDSFPVGVTTRKKMAHYIHDFIQNTRSGTLGLTGSIALIFVAISMLSRIEDTFNDIWGVAHGRSWFTRIMLYWGVISLAPLLLTVALGLASGPHLDQTRKLISAMPFIATFLFQV